MRYHADDYDDVGNLKAPWWFWFILLYLLQEWWVLALGMAMQSYAITDVLQSRGWLILLPGLCAFQALFIYPLRGRCPRGSAVSRLILLTGVLVMTGHDVYQGIMAFLLQDERISFWLSLVCFDTVCLAGVAGRRVRHVFCGRD
ncbi:hypothetical protein CI424_25235 [Salmonella enterica subsp. enterica serovar Enteritidis]|nr:hypothetical protein [Salmonella enterica subsp. enterica serovar Enteritidis]